MRTGIIKSIYRSIIYYRKALFFQFMITAFLAAIISASMLTGSSVRATLRSNTEKKLNNSGMMISSGLRFFDPNLSEKLQQKVGLKCTSLLEMKGFSSNFSSGVSAQYVQLFAVNPDFFSFNSEAVLQQLLPGQVLINKKLADHLNVQKGDDILIRFKTLSNIPLNAPFAPEKDPSESLVLTVGEIASDNPYDYFSLGISQLKPFTIFLNLADLSDSFEGSLKANRLLIQKEDALTEKAVASALQEVLTLEDFGLHLRRIEAQNQLEISSDRIFLDESTIEEIQNAVPEFQPILTYLANSLSINGKSTPYSFVAAISKELYKQAPEKQEVEINNWLAQDLSAKIGDTLLLHYYVSDLQNRLSNDSAILVVNKIVPIEKQWADASLMPEFPGISGTESCSNWDAGVAIVFKKIRDKDEAYWSHYQGTPKAFINYLTGAKIWGSNFGPATALRMSSSKSLSEIEENIKGKLNPAKLGFSVQNAYQNGINAANNSVDFSSLFLSLSFFIIASSVLLLILLLSTFFESRKRQLRTLFALGFKNGLITKMLLAETSIIAFLASGLGVFAGVPVNALIITALNSVWEGAVQTNTLVAYFDWQMIAIAFLSTLIISVLVLYFKTRNFLKNLRTQNASQIPKRSSKSIQWLFPLSIGLTLFPLLLVLITDASSTMYFFVSGGLLFISFLLFYRWMIQFKATSASQLVGKKYAWLYYAFYPSKALSTIVFIASGLFIILVTGANRKSFDSDHLLNKSGTGGYSYWCETTTPIAENMNSEEFKFDLGLENESQQISFLQALKQNGDDASCLNLNQIAAPSLLGIDSEILAESESFSFASLLSSVTLGNPWKVLQIPAKENCIYGIADQTVLQWGMKMKVGDTLTMLAESGEALHIILAAGLEPSVFQGSVLIGRANFSRFFPSLEGVTVFLAQVEADQKEVFLEKMQKRFRNYGLSMEQTQDRLSAFYEVTNTYLTVFMSLGGLGMLLGIFGLGLIMLRNIESRKNEYAFLMASGFTIKRIRNRVYQEYALILFAGILAGSVPAFLATFPSLITSNQIPWLLLLAIVAVIAVAGLLIIRFATKRFINIELIGMIRKD
ncbi:MAG: ABC transporter permease [Bacteroidales bacterium]|nr:ABC transporter permease [Bacteroidales bacterium]